MTTSRTGTGVLSGDDGSRRRGSASTARAAGHPLPEEGSGIVMADIDFSHVNLEYLICARDLARSYPDRAALLLGATPDLVRLLAEVDPATLVAMTANRAPLLVLRREPWWLQRLFTAFRAGRTEEVWAVLDQEGLMVLRGGPGGAEA
jgi:hypothetical protein